MGGGGVELKKMGFMGSPPSHAERGCVCACVCVSRRVTE